MINYLFHEPDLVRQALLEIYVAVAAEMKYNLARIIGRLTGGSLSIGGERVLQKKVKIDIIFPDFANRDQALHFLFGSSPNRVGHFGRFSIGRHARCQGGEDSRGAPGAHPAPGGT
jgi:hypothetical protein